MTLPDGTQVTTRVAADPRFAMMAPYVRYEKTRLPSVMERVIERARTVTLADPGNWFSLVSSQDTTKLCDSFPPAPAPCVGRTWTRSYNAATQTETVVSPMNRVRTTTYDALGRVLQVATPGDHSLAFEYDALGRLLTTRHGPVVGGRATTREYGTDGLLLELTDPLLQTTTFGRNARGDVTLETRPDLRPAGRGPSTRRSHMWIVGRQLHCRGSPAFTFRHDARSAYTRVPPHGCHARRCDDGTERRCRLGSICRRRGDSGSSLEASLERAPAVPPSVREVLLNGCRRGTLLDDLEVWISERLDHVR